MQIDEDLLGAVKMWATLMSIVIIVAIIAPWLFGQLGDTRWSSIISATRYRGSYRPTASSRAACGDAALSTSDQKSSAYNAVTAPINYPPFLADYMNEVRRNFLGSLPNYLTTFPETREEALTHLAIDYSAALNLERAARYIFGSQIDALNFLSSRGGSATKELLQQFYINGSLAFPAAYTTYSFDQWLHFLVSWHLIAIDWDNTTLTLAGKAILPYMYNWGYLTLRPPG